MTVTCRKCGTGFQADGKFVYGQTSNWHVCPPCKTRAAKLWKLKHALGNLGYSESEVYLKSLEKGWADQYEENAKKRAEAIARP